MNGRSSLYPWPLTYVDLPAWVYAAIVPVAFAKNTNIRKVTERLFRGALRRWRNELCQPFGVYPSLSQGIMISPDEIEFFRAGLLSPWGTQISYGIGWLIGADLNREFNPDEYDDPQWAVLNLAFLRPFE
ncbi:MAG: hypothetical protein NTY66_04310 [Candidatus Vogelbacteria bacterium]|nr:hypothetical protein [Candidatus Vogelbacteria bacterium]